MGVVNHSYSGFGRGSDGSGGCYSCGTKPEEVGHMSGDAGALHGCKVIHC